MACAAASVLCLTGFDLYFLVTCGALGGKQSFFALGTETERSAALTVSKNARAVNYINQNSGNKTLTRKGLGA